MGNASGEEPNSNFPYSQTGMQTAKSDGQVLFLVSLLQCIWLFDVRSRAVPWRVAHAHGSPKDVAQGVPRREQF